MEPHPRTPARTHGLRPLGLPRPVLVSLDESRLPAAVTRMSRSQTTLAVSRVEEIWRIAEEWWRSDPLDRTYYRLLLADGRIVTLFHDDAEASGDSWYEQGY